MCLISVLIKMIQLISSKLIVDSRQTNLKDGPSGPPLFPKGGDLLFLMYTDVALIRPILSGVTKSFYSI